LRKALRDDGESIEVITVPELFARAPGPRVVSLVADALADELDIARRSS
jgi:hypothetical protein